MIIRILTAIAIAFGLIAANGAPGEWRIRAESRTEFPPMPTYAPDVHLNTVITGIVAFDNGCMCHECYHFECFNEAADEFTALFNSYEIKRAKNGRMMIRSGHEGAFRFARKS